METYSSVLIYIFPTKSATFVDFFLSQLMSTLGQCQGSPETLETSKGKGNSQVQITDHKGGRD